METLILGWNGATSGSPGLGYSPSLQRSRSTDHVPAERHRSRQSIVIP